MSCSLMASMLLAGGVESIGVNGEPEKDEEPIRTVMSRTSLSISGDEGSASKSRSTSSFNGSDRLFFTGKLEKVDWCEVDGLCILAGGVVQVRVEIRSEVIGVGPYRARCN